MLDTIDMTWLTAINLGLACIATGAAVSAAHSARKALSRPPPICETSTRPDTPWPGWTQVTLTITNGAQAALTIDRIDIPPLGRGGIVQREAILKPAQTVTKSYLTGGTQTETRYALPKDPPEGRWQRTIRDIGLTIPGRGWHQRSLTLLCPPDAGTPATLRLRYSWSDRRHSRMTIKAQT